MPELAAVAVGNGRVADVVVARGELAGGSVEEERRGAEGVLEHLAGGTDVVGREEAVVPGERRRVTGVVEDGRENGAVAARHAPDEKRVVGRSAGVVAAGEPPRVLVPVVAVGGQAAAAVPVGHVRLHPRRPRFEDRVGDVPRKPVEVRPDQLDPGSIVELRVRVRAGMGVGHRDE